MPLRVRGHVRLRVWTCPFDAVLERAPTRGRLLEVGCGHGVFSNAAAFRGPALRVLGVDPAMEKIRWAQRTARERPNVEFLCTELASIEEENFDTIAILDVLYLVRRANWVAFLTECARRLRPGGQLLLKEVDRRPWWKFYRCVAQETLSVRVLGITRGGPFAFAGTEEMIGVLQQAGFVDVRAQDLGGGYLTPHVLYEAHRG